MTRIDREARGAGGDDPGAGAPTSNTTPHQGGRLASLEVLIVDCQSTGASPRHGSIVELGWTRTRAMPAGEPNGDAAPCSQLVALPEGQRIPGPVARLTGLRTSDLSDAASDADVWRALREACRNERLSDVDVDVGVHHLTPTVIHFARFEEPFLRDLHDRFDDGAFPFDIVCTHEIARRLLPRLPRRGLRALAGYFGGAPGLLRRSAEHVAATMIVWRHLVDRLATEAGVTSWTDLRAWLRESPRPGASEREFPLPRERRLALPDEPGVYRFRRTSGDVLYIGKATSLRRRVNSYFHKRRGVGERLLEMLTQARDLDVIPTATALEAALLESDEIKRHAPPYNIALRDEARGVWFADSCFTAVQPSPDAVHRVGPLPSRRAVLALDAVARWLSNPEDIAADDLGLALGVWAARAPELDCARAGLERFCRTYDLAPPATPGTVAPSVPRRTAELLHRSRRLWRLLAERRATPDGDDGTHGSDGTHGNDGSDRGNDGSDRGTDAPVWTPESVVEALEASIARAGHQVRRSRWLCRLAESTVAWESTRGPRALSITTGHVEATSGETSALRPTDASRPRLERQRAFDVATHDRLRVLTTELRRLVSTGRRIELHLGGPRALGAAELARVLLWV